MILASSQQPEGTTRRTATTIGTLILIGALTACSGGSSADTDPHTKAACEDRVNEPYGEPLALQDQHTTFEASEASMSNDADVRSTAHGLMLMASNNWDPNNPDDPALLAMLSFQAACARHGFGPSNWDN